MRVEKGELRGKLKFAENDEEADKAWNLAKQGVLRAVSVGFRVGKVSEKDDHYELSENELYECSLVSIPSNAQSLARAALKREMKKVKKRKVVRAVAPTETSVRKLSQGTSRADQAALRVLEGQVTSLNGQLATERATHEKAVAKLKARAIKAEKANKKLESKRVDSMVRGFVGKKLTEAQVPEWLELARADEARFKRLIAAQPDLKLEGGPILGKRADKPNSAESRTGTDGKAKAIRAAADKIMERDGCNRFDAMLKARAENPDLR